MNGSDAAEEWYYCTPLKSNGSLDDDAWKYQLLADSPLSDFSVAYQKVHGYAGIVICTFGIVSNLMNAVVLSRKTMLSATNYLLTALAVVDGCTMTSYLPYATYFFCVTSPDNKYPHARGSIVYLLITTNLFITFHTIAMWLTVALAIFRYVVVCRRTSGASITGPLALRRAKMAIVIVLVGTVLFCVPNYVMLCPAKLGENGEDGWWFDKNSFVTPAMESYNFQLFGILHKVVPCVLLAVLSSLLIRAMRAANQSHQRLLSQGKREESERTIEHNRTTAMLVAVVLLVVVTELPQGILALLSSFDNTIFYSFYVPLGDVWDIIVLINSAVNFILYCIMSQQFRRTFRDVFCRGRRFSSSGCDVTRMVTCDCCRHKTRSSDFNALEPLQATQI